MVSAGSRDGTRAGEQVVLKKGTETLDVGDLSDFVGFLNHISRDEKLSCQLELRELFRT